MNCYKENALSAARLALSFAAIVGALACSDDRTPVSPSPTPTPNPTVTSVAVAGTDAFSVAGATAQFTATATLSNGTTENRTATATWSSSNTAVATVSGGGLVTVAATGDATITASIAGVSGTRNVRVRLRTPDPAAGQRIPLPDVRAFITQTAAARTDLIAQSCPNGRKYENNPWLDYMVDALRRLDSRWGYNGKPTRTAADNNGFPVIAAGDEIAYHFGPGPDQNSPDVYLIDILVDHCGRAPAVTYRHFTGEEPGFWTGAGRLSSANEIAPTVLPLPPGASGQR